MLRFFGLLLLAACSASPGEVPREADAAATQVDATARDAATNFEAAEEDATHDAALSPSASCTVDDMTKIYAGSLPTNPYSNQPNANACVASAHDVIVVLGCPTNADGSPASCQTKRADMAIALSRAGFSDRFITSGAAVQNKYVEADSLAALLVTRGIREDHILKDTKANHTDENLYYSSAIMQAQGWTTALVVSDDPGHLIMTAVCDANCCVNLGRLTVFDFAVTSGTQVAGHYVLYPSSKTVSESECTHIEQPLKLMCTNMSSRKACAGDFKL